MPITEISKATLFALGIVFIAGCSKNVAPTISTSDSTVVMVEVARTIATSSELPHGYCVDMQLDPRKTVVGGRKGSMGWTSTSTGILKYRLLESSKLGKLPVEAIAALPVGATGSDCRHRIVLHEPEFIEFAREGKNTIGSVVTLDDHCPLCGAGYAISLTKQGGRWAVEQPGVARTWIS